MYGMLITRLDDKQIKSLSAKLSDAIGWFDWALEDFITGETMSVSGENNAKRLSRACDILKELESELQQLERIVVGKRSDDD